MNCVGKRELLLSTQPLAQGLALDQRHDVVQEGPGLVRCFPRVVQGENVGMVQTGGGRDLVQEALRPEDVGQVGAKHFHCHLTPVPDVLREIDRGHAALAQFAVEAVAVGESTLQSR